VQGAFLLLPLRMITRLWHLFGFVLLINVSSCQEEGNNKRQTGQYKKPSQFESEIVAGKFSDQTDLQLDTAIVEKFTTHYPEFRIYKDALLRFYGNREQQMAWFDHQGLVEQALILYNRILSMEENGVPTEIHYASSYYRTMSGTQKDSLSWQELMITSQYLHFAEKTIIGLPKKILDQTEWFIPRKKISFLDLLDQMVADETTNSRNEVFFQYNRLRQHLKLLVDIEKKGGWGTVEINKKTIHPGDSSGDVVKIRKRLQREGYSMNDTLDPHFDTPMSLIIREFQSCHGIVADGLIGASTIAAMNVPVKIRQEQIMVNMERCRWLPITPKEPYLIVNIPAFQLDVMESDTLRFSLAAIVGKATDKTAIFKGYLNQIVFSPYWYVPQSILHKEIIPVLKKDPGYLERNNMEWMGSQLRQKPGPDNALGGVKFLFPNPFNIYLHDTPSKGLFKQEKRTFSHGCIRISEPAKLAEYLLKSESGWNKEKIDDAMHASKEQHLLLKKGIPVYVLYLTAFVDEKSRLQFREDVYGRDRAILAMLVKKNN
jgi:L,D-transpeptidase YcbB